MPTEKKPVGDPMSANPADVPDKPSVSPGQAGNAPRTLAGPWVMAAAGIVAGLVGWCVLEASFPVFRVSEELLERIPLSFPPSELLAEVDAAKHVVNLKNGMVVGLLLGTLAAAAFSVAQGMPQDRQAYGRLALCVACGGVAGMLAGLVSQLWMNRLLPSVEPMTAAVAIQAVFWGVLGTGFGVGVGLFSGSVPQFFGLLVKGLVAGTIFGLLYAVAAAYAFPADNAEQLIPASLGNRGVWAVAGIAVTGLLLGDSSQRRRNRPIAS